MYSGVFVEKKYYLCSNTKDQIYIDIIMKHTEYYAPDIEVLNIVVEQGFSISDFDGDLEFPEDGGEI